MDFDEFFSRLEKWEEQTEEDSRRKAITTVLRSKPNAYKDAIVKSALDRIMWYFENGKFGVVSVCKTNNSKKKNFDIQLRLMLKLKEQKLHCIPHIGFWERIASRSLFVPQISRKRIRILAKELKLEVFIWGERRDWKCYRTCNRNILFKDNKLKVIIIDMDFLIYSRITARKNQLLGIINQIQNNHWQKKTSNEILVSIKTRIKDLQQVQRDLCFAEQSVKR